MRALFALILIGCGLPAAAQTPPFCTPQRAGQVACVENRMCECRHDPGGTMVGRPAGWRWDCGILRPQCRSEPATLDKPQPLPPGLLLQLPQPQVPQLPR